MSDCDLPYTQQEFYDAASQVAVQFTKVTGDIGTISWNLPSDLTLYDGIVVLISETEFVPTDFPVDGTRYTASQDFNAPADKVGNANVAGAYYNDKITKSVNVIGLDPNKTYFVSAHPVTNALQYFTVGRQSYPLLAKTEEYIGDLPEASTPPLNPSVGQVYYNTQLGKVYMWSGSSWINAGVGTTVTGSQMPASLSTVGQFFFNTTTKTLYSWDGTEFVEANTANKGVPTYNKKPGNNGSYAERANLISVIKRQLGWPTICIELNEEHFNFAIDNALLEFRRRADNAYKSKYYALPLLKNQETYFLNDPVSGTNSIVEVIKIWRLSNMGLITQGQNGLYSQGFLQQLYAPGVVDLSSIYMINAYSEQFSQIFAGEISFGFDEASRLLKLYRHIGSDEKVILECVAERTEQELLVDRYANQWIQGWAVSEAKMTLGHIRSKYGNLPGAGGGVQLNGSELLNSAMEDQTELLRQINDFEVGNGLMSSGGFIIG